MSTEALACTDCGSSFDDPDETEIKEGEVYCRSCHCERFHFTCCRCEDCGEEAIQHAYVVVEDAPAVRLPLPGLYRIDRLPYYTQGLIGGGWVDDWAVTWLGFVPPYPGMDGYPCGHLCGPCQQAVLAELAYHEACLYAGAAGLLA